MPDLTKQTEATSHDSEILSLQLKMLEESVRKMYAEIPSSAREIPEVKESLSNLETAAQEMTFREKVEAEYLSAAEVLREANILDDKFKWVGGWEPKPMDLSPEMQRAVIRFKAAAEEKKKLPTLEEDMGLTLRSLRKLVRSPIDADVKLIIALAVAPVIVSLEFASYFVPKNEKSMVPFASVNQEVGIAEETEKTGDMLPEAEIADFSEALSLTDTVTEKYSACVTPKELEEAIESAKSASGSGLDMQARKTAVM